MSQGQCWRYLFLALFILAKPAYGAYQYFLNPACYQQGQGITCSPHDFYGTEAYGNTFQGENSCGVCHLVHGGGSVAPLWNHEITDTTFIIYDSRTMDAPEAGGVLPQDAESILCMSCHDGTVAIVADSGKYLLSGDAAFGTDLTDDHPIGISADQAGIPCTDCHTHAEPSPFKLFNGKIECGTCHDVHNKGAGDKRLLRATTSTICTHCHNK